MKTIDETVTRMIELAEEKYNCSQIMMILSLEQKGWENPELVRAMSGLGDGCGFFNETCGIMTSAAAILGLLAGNGDKPQTQSENLLPVLQDLSEWFQTEIGAHHNGTRCQDIVGDRVGTDEGKQICGGVLLRTHIKVNELLSNYGYSG